MNIAIFYFSGTGNTKWAADTFVDLLNSRGHITALYSIDDFGRNISDDALTSCSMADFIGFAQPLYGADIPKTMRRFVALFIKDTELKPGAKIFFVNTFGHVNGLGWFETKKLFKGTDYEAAAYVNLKLSDTAPKKNRASLPPGNGMPDKIKAAAKRRIDKSINKMAAGKKYINGVGPHLMIGRVIRKAIRPMLDENYLKMQIDISLCTKCLICVKNCPTESIAYKDGQFSFKNTCQACMRCVNHCPEGAVSNS